MNIEEGSGTTAGANSGSIIIDHENAGGASSITFRSRANRGSDYGYIQYQDASSVGAGGESARLIIGTQNDADDHLILLPSGNVGINTTNPLHKLDVSGNIRASGFVSTPDIYVNFVSLGGNLWHNGSARPVFYFGSGGQNYYRGGNPGDTATSPHHFRNSTDNTTVSFTHSGIVRASGGFSDVSDERIKKDIVDNDNEDSLNKILSIECKKYKYIDETKGTALITGFIAQQVLQIIPEAVDFDVGTLPNGDEIQNFHYLNKMRIFVHNIAATQELHRIITRQQAVIDSLIARIEILENS